MHEVCYLTLLFPASAPAARTTRTPRPSSLALKTALEAPARSLENAILLPAPTSHFCASPSARARNVVEKLQGFVGGLWWTIHESHGTIGRCPLDAMHFASHRSPSGILNKRPIIESLFQPPKSARLSN
jgi:hypothetical protein